MPKFGTLEIREAIRQAIDEEMTRQKSRTALTVHSANSSMLDGRSSAV